MITTHRACIVRYLGTHGETIGSRFGAGPNALTLLRLVLALEVVAWHAYALRGDTWLPDRLGFVATIGVDSFFAISGFLICAAWFRNPSLRHFAEARARRLLPALWVCLVVTAFVIAPLSVALAGQPQLSLGGRIEYVLANATTFVTTWGIDGGPSGVPHPGAWNGSLWSLSWEVVAYVAVAALGVLALLRGRVVLWLVGVLWLWQVVLVAADSWVVGTAHWWWALPHTGLMFAFGALVFFAKDRLPMSPTLAVVALGLFVAGVVATPSYRLLAPPAIAYLCLYLGLTLGRFPRLVLRHDVSYGIYIYSFPMQQALLLLGLASIGWAAFAVLSAVVTLPLAAASWLGVERPLQKRARRERGKPVDTSRPLLEPH